MNCLDGFQQHDDVGFPVGFGERCDFRQHLKEIALHLFQDLDRFARHRICDGEKKE